MRSLEWFLSLKILIELAGIFWSISLSRFSQEMSIDFILLLGILLVIDTIFWMQARKTLQKWDKRF